MRKCFALVILFAAITSLQLIALGQSPVGYTISDNDRKELPWNEQQCYSFDLNTGQGALIVGLGGQGQAPGAGGIKREYAGLASIGSTLFGVSAHFGAGTPCNGFASDPIAGLSADVRLFRTTGAYPLANGIQSAVGPQIGQTCIEFGLNAGAAYNPLDGYIYALFSDDLLSSLVPRTQLYRISPTTGLATLVTSAGAPNGVTLLGTGPVNSEFPFLDGLAILPSGGAYAVDGEFSNGFPQDPDNTNGAFDNGGLYRIFVTGPNAGRAQFVKHLFRRDRNRDTGVANLNNVIYILLENGELYNTSDNPTGTVSGPVLLNLPDCLGQGSFCGSLRGFDISQPGLR